MSINLKFFFTTLAKLIRKHSQILRKAPLHQTFAFDLLSLHSFTDNRVSFPANCWEPDADVDQPRRLTYGRIGKLLELPRYRTSCSKDGSACRCRVVAGQQSDRIHL